MSASVLTPAMNFWIHPNNWYFIFSTQCFCNTWLLHTGQNRSNPFALWISSSYVEWSKVKKKNKANRLNGESDGHTGAGSVKIKPLLQSVLKEEARNPKKSFKAGAVNAKKKKLIKQQQCFFVPNKILLYVERLDYYTWQIYGIFSTISWKFPQNCQLWENNQSVASL